MKSHLKDLWDKINQEFNTYQQMKKHLLILSLILLVFTGCKNEGKNQKNADQENTEVSTEEENQKNSDGGQVLIGDFIYSDEAAVINGKKFIYGVELDSMARVLIEKVEPYKEDEYDMIPVAVKGKVKPNSNDDGWDEVVEITKIIKISKSKSNQEAIEINSDQKSL